MGGVAPIGTTRWPLVGRQVELDRCVDALSGGVARAVFVHGASGVGKTRLADEVVARLSSEGRLVLRSRGSVASASIPLGALVHLLPAELLDDRFDPLTLYSGVARALGGDEQRSVVVFVDDAQWLDPTSAALLGQLLDGGVVSVVGTVRTGEPASSAVSGLWRRDDVLRIDLDVLSFDDVDTLLHLALGGPVDKTALGQIWAASGGNALFVKELVLGALSRGHLVERRMVWWLVGPLASTPRLAELVGQRIREVGGGERSVLEVLAVWESVGLHELTALHGPEPVEGLERAGLLEVRIDGRRDTVVLAHPLHGEVVRADLPTMTRRRLLLERAERIERFGARRREDLPQVATARLEGSGRADPDLLVRAARVARYGHDLELVLRLTAPVVADDPPPEAVLLRAEALHERGDFEEVERLLAAGPHGDGGDRGIAIRLVAMRVRNLMWGLHRPDDALRVNSEARAGIVDTDDLDELITDEALTLLYSNRPSAAILALEQMSADPRPRARVLRAIAEIPALIVTGRAEAALAAAKAAYREHLALGDQSAIAHPGIHLVYRMEALLDLGRIAEANAIAELGYGHAARGGPPLGRDWFGLGLGRAALMRGEPRTAARWLAESLVLSVSGGFDGPQRLELSWLAMAQAWLAQLDEAQTNVEQAVRLAPSAFHEAEQDLGRAWTLVASGEVERARAVLTAAASHAAATDHRMSEAWLLHDVARLGDAGAVVGRLEELTRWCEGPLVTAYAAHARAAVARDGGGLDEAAGRFESMQMHLLAAEAATAAADAHRRARRQRSANASLAHAHLLAARCEGARTPGLLSTDALVPLTSREREVGALAAAGITSKEIATRLYLSARTVENHLQNVYTKLGVSSRADLADALGASAQSPPSAS